MREKEIVEPKDPDCKMCGAKKDNLMKSSINGKYYYQSRCRKCKKENSLDYYYNNRDRYKEVALDYYHMYRINGINKPHGRDNNVAEYFRKVLEEKKNKPNKTK